MQHQLTCSDHCHAADPVHHCSQNASCARWIKNCEASALTENALCLTFHLPPTIRQGPGEILEPQVWNASNKKTSGAILHESLLGNVVRSARQGDVRVWHMEFIHTEKLHIRPNDNRKYHFIPLF